MRPCSYEIVLLDKDPALPGFYYQNEIPIFLFMAAHQRSRIQSKSQSTARVHAAGSFTSTGDSLREQSYSGPVCANERRQDLLRSLWTRKTPGGPAWWYRDETALFWHQCVVLVLRRGKVTVVLVRIPYMLIIQQAIIY
ncbi:hypothetical protein VF12_38795, partial [Nostoc linckia z15]